MPYIALEVVQEAKRTDLLTYLKYMLTKENFNESHKLRGMEVEGVDTCMLKEYLEKTTVTTNRFS